MLLNAGIVMCSFIETYVFPFAVIKWMIVITKYGGLVSLLRRYKDAYVRVPPPTPLRSQFKYSLQLNTTYKKSIGDWSKYVSNVTVMIEEVDDFTKRTQVLFRSLLILFSDVWSWFILKLWSSIPFTIINNSTFSYIFYDSILHHIRKSLKFKNLVNN